MMRTLFPLVLGLYGVAFATPLPGVESSDGDDDGAEDPSYVPGGDDIRGQIVNGTEIDEGDWQEVVHLNVSGPTGSGSCTGSLIHPEWILTAAHCMHKDTTSITVTFGNESSDSDKMEAVEWIQHQGWDETDLIGFDYDIAVVKLGAPRSDIIVMALNDQPVTDDWIDQQINFIGFGITNTGRNDGGTKREADVPITGVAKDRIFTYDGVQSTCQGDSGGPGVVFSGQTYAQVSITSYGSVPCGSGRSGSHRVDAKLAWLRSRGVPFTTKPGAPPTFECSREQDPDADTSRAVGVVDFDLKCNVTYHEMENITGATWNWGDGESSEGIDVEHLYTKVGNHTMRVCIDGEVIDDETEESTPWQHCITRPGYVLACGIPDVEFSLEQLDGLNWQFLNQTDLSTFGCIQNIQWEVFHKGDAEPFDTFQSWEPEYTFPEKGEYTIVLNVGGMGGTAAATIDVEVKRTGGTDTRACDTTGGTFAFGGFLLLLGLPLIRRRRND
ncbi:MAG: V8-like Glu-specific endopeptidase/PKD repeat protein [Kiritimatiellia bacterium]|jgi:V8-like Glu-specific endopeptidase/PKD repeat protein